MVGRRLQIIFPRILQLANEVTSESIIQLCKRFINVFSSVLKKATDGVIGQTNFSKILSFSMGKRIDLIPNAVNIDKNIPGYVFPMIPLYIQHSISFWINRTNAEKENIEGSILVKGIPAILGEQDISEIWSYCGIGIDEDAKLNYSIAAGENRTFKLKGNSILPADKWVHVALIQRNKECELYVNGTLDAKGFLDDHMLLVGKKSSRVIDMESVHPYRDCEDKYYIVEVPKAVRYTISFDTRSSTESIYDYLRFYKDDSYTDYWGEDKYSGRHGDQNFPGCGGRPPLVIPASRFIVYFHSDEQTNDWGYKFSCKVELLEEGESGGERFILNDGPIYIGQAPGYAYAKRCVKASLCSVSFFDHALNMTELSDLFVASPSDFTKMADSKFALNVLSVLDKCFCVATENAGQPTLLSDPTTIFNLLVLIKNASPLVSISALRVASKKFPYIDPSVIDNEFRNVSSSSSTGSFIEFLINNAGKSFNTWSKVSARKSTASPSSEFDFAFASECVKFLRKLCSSDIWHNSVGIFVAKINNAAPKLLQAISTQAQADSIGPTPPATEVSAPLVNDLNILFGMFAIFGGHVQGIHIGSDAFYHTGDDTCSGIIENCTVISPSWPPRIKENDKEAQLLWSGLTSYGDALYISVKSQPNELKLVPKNRISFSAKENLKEISNFVDKNIDALLNLMYQIVEIDATDPRPKLLPKVQRFEELAVYESSHPYENSLDRYTLLHFPGASKMTIHFNVQSEIEKSSDYLRFYKDERQTDYYGESSYSGRSFPGINGCPPLVIYASSCLLYFHADSSNSCWGYKFHVIAEGKELLRPPHLPPLIHNSLLGAIKMAGLKAFNSLLSDMSGFIASSIPLLKPLVFSSWHPLPRIGNVPRKPSELVIESRHPYENSLDTFTPITVKGAKSLVIFFDEASCTESGCDYITFFKDESKTEYWGEHRYSGNNWPGVGTIEPLKIPSSTFLLYFHSDGSVNDWGYKIFVRVDTSADVSDETLNLYSIDYSMFCIGQLLTDGHTVKYPQIDIRGFEAELLGSFFVDPSSYMLDTPYSSSSLLTNLDSLTVKYAEERKREFVVNLSDASFVHVHKTASVDSAIIGTFTEKDVIISTGERGDWLSVELIQAKDSKTTIGWVLRRFSDQVYLISATKLAQSPIMLKSGPPLCSAGHDMIRSCGIPFAYRALEKKNTRMTISCDSCGQENLQSSDYFHHCAMCRFDLCSCCAYNDSVDNRLSPDDEPGIFYLDTDINVPAKVTSGFKVIEPTRKNEDSSFLLFPQIELLRGNSCNAEALFADYIYAGSIMYARECINTMLSIWPVDASLSQDSFGSVSHFLTFLKAVYIEESKLQNYGPRILKMMFKSIQDILRNKRRKASEFCDSLVGFSTHQISDTLKFLTSMKKTKAIVKTFESTHPYSDNHMETTEIYIKGAKYLKLVFDQRSATQEGCDYVEVCKDESHSLSWHDWKYSGSQGSTCWSKTCTVLSDKCYLHFHSDGLKSDWGYKVTCYGIIEEPDADEREDQVDMLNSYVIQANLAFWILDIICGESNAEMLSKLFIPKTIRTLRRYTEVISWDRKLEVSRIICSISHQIHKVSISEAVIQELDTLLKSLTSLMKEKYVIDNVAAPGTPSQVLQVLVEAVFILDAALSDKILKSGKFSTRTRLPDGVIPLTSPSSG